MSGTAVYRVVKPEQSWELHKQLLDAAPDRVLTSFEAVLVDDPQEEPELRTFTVRVRVAHFDSPDAFEVTHIDPVMGEEFEIMIRFPVRGSVTFELYS